MVKQTSRLGWLAGYKYLTNPLINDLDSPSTLKNPRNPTKMGFSFLLSIFALILCFSAISVTTATYVVDTKGEPLIDRIASYYIVPQNIGIGGGLTTTEIDGKCPLFVTKVDEYFWGIPVTITTQNLHPYVLLFAPVTIQFTYTISTCIPSLVWQIKDGNVVADGPISNPIFSIKRKGEAYSIIYFDSEGKERSLGFHKVTGFLGLTDDEPLLVKFTSSIGTTTALQMSTSSV